MGWRGEWARDKVTKRRRGKERVEWGRGPWRAVLAFLPGAPEFQLTPLAMILIYNDYEVFIV